MREHLLYNVAERLSGAALHNALTGAVGKKIVANSVPEIIAYSHKSVNKNQQKNLNFSFDRELNTTYCISLKRQQQRFFPVLMFTIILLLKIIRILLYIIIKNCSKTLVLNTLF